MATITALEQLLIELVNRARADPAAEAARFGTSLNAGLPAGTISTAAKEPLAIHPALLDAADRHSQAMVADDFFSHTGVDGSTAADRMRDAGWTSGPGGWRAGENIAGRFTYASTVATAATIEDHHRGLFLSAGHRRNILEPGFSEIGVGQAIGAFTLNGTTYPQSSLVTENFADGGRTYITGVVIDDRDGDRFYDIGEGLGSVSVTVTGSGVTRTGETYSTGGYAILVPNGTFTVTFSGGGLDAPVTRTVTVNGANVKVDAVDGDSGTAGGGGGGGGATSGADLISGGATGETINALGGNDTVRGNGGADTLSGDAGNDRLEGGDGNDRLLGGEGRDRLIGGDGNDSLYGGNDIDRLSGGRGNDVLFGEAGNDVLMGNAGNDQLIGGDGDDTLRGSTGDDTVNGGAGRDLIVYDSGRDTIVFTPDVDRVDVSRTDIDSFAELQSRLEGGAGGAILDIAAGDAIVFSGLAASALDASDFIF